MSSECTSPPAASQAPNILHIHRHFSNELLGMHSCCCLVHVVVLLQPLASSPPAVHKPAKGEHASESNLWLTELQTRPMVLLALAL